MKNIIKMYADDTKIITKVGKESESETIQQDLNICTVWNGQKNGCLLST